LPRKPRLNQAMNENVSTECPLGSNKCVDDETLVKMLDGTLDQVSFRTIEEKIMECETCSIRCEKLIAKDTDCTLEEETITLTNKETGKEFTIRLGEQKEMPVGEYEILVQTKDGWEIASDGKLRVRANDRNAFEVTFRPNTPTNRYGFRQFRQHGAIRSSHIGHQ